MYCRCDVMSQWYVGGSKRTKLSICLSVIHITDRKDSNVNFYCNQGLACDSLASMQHSTRTHLSYLFAVACILPLVASASTTLDWHLTGLDRQTPVNVQQPGLVMCPMYLQLPYTCLDGSTSHVDMSDSCHNKQTCTPPEPVSCKPINYMPIACADGVSSQPIHDEHGCITGYSCPVAGFVPAAKCQAWNDGCNTCSRNSPDANPMCTMRACILNTVNPAASTSLESHATSTNIWQGRGYCITEFPIATSTPATHPHDTNHGTSTPPVSPPTPTSTTSTTTPPRLCFDDLMQCRDGSYVGRIGPVCAFAACPTHRTTR